MLAHLADQPIGPIPAYIRAGRHAKASVEGEPEPAHDLVQRRVRADAGAASGEILVSALEHVDFPADPTKQVRSEQAANRASDDQCPARDHLSTSRG